MRMTVSAALVFIMIATGSPVRLRAAGDEVGTFRSSIEGAAKSFASSQATADTTANAGWNRVANLSVAQRIVIRTRDGRLVHAAFVEADDVSLTVLTGRVRQSFGRADIVDVTSAPEGSRVGAYIGASLGLVIGFALGASVGLGCNSHCSGGDNNGT